MKNVKIFSNAQAPEKGSLQNPIAQVRVCSVHSYNSNKRVLVYKTAENG